jgi:hypothetical protein
MADAQDIRTLLEAAEHAASAGDLVAAEAALRDAARLQEAELGAHPDLASTLNNLAVVTEKTGRPDEAEAFFRRAFAIASASLPADDPTVAEIRQNLEDFCRARGVPFEQPTVPPAAARAETSAVVAPRAQEAIAPRAPEVVAPRVQEVVPPVPLAASPRRAPIALIVFAAIAVIAIAFAILRPRSPREASTPASAPPASSVDRPAEPPPASAATAPAEAAPSAPANPATPAAASAASDVTVASAQLCRNFSTVERTWRCDPAGDSVPTGSLVLYTRVRSPRDGTVVHRWFRGESMRKSSQLQIRANPAEGYRTYSRQTVDPGEWRVEVRSAAGALLHEQRFTVR